MSRRENGHMEQDFFLKRFVCVCLALMAFLMALLSAFNLLQDGALWALLPAVILFLALLLLYRKPRLSAVRTGILIFAAAFVLKAIFALAVDTQPMYDFARHLEAAQRIAGGEWDALNDYLVYQIWSYQSFFVIWMALLIKLFGAGVTFFKLTNCVFSALSSLFIYLIARKFAGEWGGRVGAIVYILFPGSFLLIPVLTNQHMAECLMLAAVLVFTSENRRVWVFAGALLCLSNLIRPAGLVMLAAVGVLFVQRLIYDLIKKRPKESLPLLKKIVVLFVSYFVLTAAASWAVQASGLNDNGLGNVYPEWKFIVGLNPESGGNWNQTDFDLVYGEDATDESVAALYAERLSISPGALIRLMGHKLMVMWGQYETDYWTFQHLQGSTVFGSISFDALIQVVLRLTGGLYVCYNLLIAAGAVGALRKREKSLGMLLLTLMALCYFSVQLLVEVQVRYRSLMTAVSAPLAGAGAVYVRERLNAALGRRR